MDVQIDPIYTMLLPLAAGAAACLIGVATIVSVYRFGLSAERSVFITLLALFGLFAISDYFLGIQIPVVLVLGVIACGLIFAIVVKRIGFVSRVALVREI
ncbi:hypothetical protein [Phyllobacterium sp. P30BS-XVII]|uniref:hypothetical protein n=1 Tax=Phyllobacterium sp. P30BS-XVII TaxID=2587046 RepID=UPI000DD898C1|nr:hypothetical protein [Phyllobacterium sp. P30BS-XVII]MBA8903065.1 hypothetical protein [Phyllobacterium sp. P30BS-XVII]